MDLTKDRSNGGLAIGFLDFPKGGTFGLDGQNIVLKTDDFVGVTGVPINAFHLVTCKNGHGIDHDTPNTIDTAVTVGFLLFGNDENGHLVRRYDPTTEEVASEERCPVDEITQRNLVQQMTDGSLPSSRVFQYDQIVGCGTANQGDHLLSHHEMWKEQTSFIHDSFSRSRISLLKDIRKLSPGDKIVPGCYDPEDEINSEQSNPINASMVATEEQNNDGKSLTYPPIPVVDPGLSLAKHKHLGTNRFLSKLRPNERTRLFLSSSAEAFVWLDVVLKDSYRGSWEALLGDLQLSYVLFLYLGCYSSLGHWKDILAMLSLAIEGISGDSQIIKPHQHESLYRGLLRLLPYQLSSMNDPEFLEDIDEGGGNFLIPSLDRLKRYYETKSRDGEEENMLSKFRHVLSAKFPQTFFIRPSLPTITRIRSDSDDEQNSGDGNVNKITNHGMDVEMTKDNHGWNSDDDDEDGPVMVSSEEIEASMARSSSVGIGINAGTNDSSFEIQKLTRDYPLLAAAIMPSEDVIMTCARALDEKTDVSLVREAAAYLEEVENRRGFF